MDGEPLPLSSRPHHLLIDHYLSGGIHRRRLLPPPLSAARLPPRATTVPKMWLQPSRTFSAAMSRVWRTDMNRRRGAAFIRVTLAALGATALFAPFAAAQWTLFPVQPFDPQTGADPVYVSGPVSDLFGYWTDWTWRFSLASGEAFVGALLGIALIALFPSRTQLPSATLCADSGPRGERFHRANGERNSLLATRTYGST